jgi:inner membrane protein
MFIAHLPSGYLSGCYASGFFSPNFRKSIFSGFLVGSILPDIDVLYFYLIDHGRHHHHHYWTHLPVFWVASLALGLSIALLRRDRILAMFASALFLGTFLHLLLDTPFAGVAWAYPLSSHLFHLVTVPATRNWWVLSFVLHWSFLFELVICFWALGLFLYRRSHPSPRPE